MLGVHTTKHPLETQTGSSSLLRVLPRKVLSGMQLPQPDLCPHLHGGSLGFSVWLQPFLFLQNTVTKPRGDHKFGIVIKSSFTNKPAKTETFPMELIFWNSRCRCIEECQPLSSTAPGCVLDMAFSPSHTLPEGRKETMVSESPFKISTRPWIGYFPESSV